MYGTAFVQVVPLHGIVFDDFDVGRLPRLLVVFDTIAPISTSQ